MKPRTYYVIEYQVWKKLWATVPKRYKTYAQAQRVFDKYDFYYKKRRIVKRTDEVMK